MDLREWRENTLKGVDRHTHWPTTGRASNKTQSLTDALLIKEMNMNAVRMSHYPPDRHFLDVCDSLGLYVIDELTAWQYPPYDTKVGRKLVRELITRDVNHPCIVLWANGNKGI
jgi:beta-galactosidase/beta-glucuronidase